ncbi:MAG: Fe(3+) ABC transporter substrate-binding protein [Trueperaceae bacterium]
MTHRPTPIRPFAPVAILALLASLALGALSFGVAQDEVNLYSARHYDTDDQLYALFEERTGITVNVLEGNSDELIQRMTSEGANSPADVFITVDAGRLWRAEEAGLLASTHSDVLDERIPENLSHPNGLWFGFSQRVRGIVYSVDAVDPSELSTYEALADDAWEGRICIRSSSNVYNQSLLASLIATNGADEAEAWAAGIVDNMARSPQGGDTDQIRGVAAGECDVAVANHYYLARLITSNDANDRAVAEQVGYFFPNQDGRGTHVNVSGAGVVATAPNPDAAVRFLEFLASDEAQEIFAGANNEYPAVEGVAVSEVTQGFGEYRTDALNVATYGENNPEAVRVFDRVGWR